MGVLAWTAGAVVATVGISSDAPLHAATRESPTATVSTVDGRNVGRWPYGRSMVLRFDLVTFDSPSPDDLANFWSAVLGMVETEREDVDRWIVLGTPDGTRRLGIQRGTSEPGSVHLDLACSPTEFDAESVRVIALGAVPLGPPRHEPYGSILNLADPDGNPFDLCAYH